MLNHRGQRKPVNFSFFTGHFHFGCSKEKQFIKYLEGMDWTNLSLGYLVRGDRISVWGPNQNIDSLIPRSVFHLLVVVNIQYLVLGPGFLKWWEKCMASLISWAFKRPPIKRSERHDLGKHQQMNHPGLIFSPKS